MQGGEALPLPPPLIICGAGVTQAGATGAYKDLCAGKGIRLQPQTNGGAAPSHTAPSPAPRQFALASGSGPSVVPGNPNERLLAASGLEGFAKSGKAGNLSFLLASPHPGLPVPQFPTETTELNREGCSLGAIA